MSMEFGDEYLAQLWDEIDWNAAESKLAGLQRRLSIAAFRKDDKGIVDLQKRIVRDLDIKCLAVRHVVNSTSSPGVDGVKWRTSGEKMRAAMSLTSKGYHASPMRQILIVAKNTGKERRPQLPTYRDRAMSVLYGYSLIPVTEALAERKSFVGEDYVESRTHEREIQNVTGPYRAIWLRQNGLCYYCGRPILNDQPRTTVQLDLRNPPSIRNSAYIHKICAQNEFELIQEMESLDSLKPFDVLDTLREIQEAPPKGARGKKDITPKWKHYGLKTFLASCTSASITLSFHEIEKLDGLPLAASAYKNKDWWYPRQNCNTIAETWLTEGYYLSNVDFQKQKVTLRRDEDGMAKLDIPRALTDGKIPENAKYELETHMAYIIKKYGL